VAATESMRLELTWPNKDKFLLSPKDETGKPVWVDRRHPAANEVRLIDFTGTCGDVSPESRRAADNLLFTGDSLDVLRILAEHPEFRREYRNKVKCVYIDPPFNTGQAFEHYDDWMEHSTWLSFMRDRLMLIRDLLAEDGSVWVHLDDVEAHRMRCLLDEVFGAGNFVASVAWQKLTGRDNRTDISTTHDTITVYARNKTRFAAVRNLLPFGEEQLARYSNPDNDPRGPWSSGDLTAKADVGRRAAQFYDVVTPSGRRVSPPPGRCWLYTEPRFEEMDSQGRIFWRGGDSVPRFKRFLTDVAGGLVPNTWWSAEDVGTNDSGKKEIVALFPGIAPFSTPKPEALLERVIHVASNPGDVVLDCFGGSGTTAAVAHKLSRRWVTSEILPETVHAFTSPRLSAVVDGSDRGGISKTLDWQGGGGFRCATIAPSMYEVAENGMVLLADWATNGRFSRAVAAQLDFDFDIDGAPFCGHRGRMRLSVLDGALGAEEIRTLVAALGDDERVTVVAKVVLPGAEEMLGVLSKGSRIRKAPRDVLADGSRKARRRERTAP